MVPLKRFIHVWGRFFISIVLPTFIAILLTISALYLVIIPEFEKSFVDGKKEMILELTKSAWGILDFYRQQEEAGLHSRAEAQQRALSLIKTMRYGQDNRDYFWIINRVPVMVMHPYSEELVGVDLSSFKDTQGKQLFVEIKRTVEQQDSGFVDYSWHRKYSEEMVVPKLSFVKLFAPWDWVIATGVFLDDVEKKTAEISGHLSRMSLAAVALLTIILFYVGRQSYLSEKQRNNAQRELATSRLKYKRLVETATDPLLMFFEGRCIYSNKPAQALTGLTAEELDAIAVGQIFSRMENGAPPVFSSGGRVEEGRFTANLLRPDGEPIEVQLSISKIALDGREAAAISIKDNSSTKLMERELDESREKYRQLTSRLNIPIFRAEADRQLKLLEANHAFYELTGLEEGVSNISLRETFGQHDISNLYDLVAEEGYLKNRIIRLRHEDVIKYVSLSLVLTKNTLGEAPYCDGIMEDVSEEIRREEDREKLIVELQTSLLFLNQPVMHVPGDFLVCDGSLPVYQAARLMKEGRSSSILVKNAAGEVAGIATDMALRDRVVAGKMDYATPVIKVMSAPLIFIEGSALIFEAVMLMEEKGVKHLVVKDETDEVVSVLSNVDLLNVHRYSSAFLVNEINDAADTSEIVASHVRLPRIIKSLVDSGAHARNITRITSMVSEAVLLKFFEFAIREMGEPPARFAFICLGSEGREEQTLATDQDNALIYEDVEESRLEQVNSYFLKMSEKICAWLDQAGYVLCKGDVMAMNPRWCRPLSTWKEYFSTWINEAKPQDLMEVSIFFDFRCMYGEKGLVTELREHIGRRVENRDAFFYQLAQNALLFKLPLDFFGNIAVESGGEHPNTFNIKHAIALIVGYARLYAINFGLEETNTLQRLDRLKLRGFIGKGLHKDLTEAYNYLMQIRFMHQVKRLDEGLKPDNHIFLEELNYMEKNALKNIFGHVGALQKKLSAIGKVEIFF